MLYFLSVVLLVFPDTVVPSAKSLSAEIPSVLLAGGQRIHTALNASKTGDSPYRKKTTVKAVKTTHISILRSSISARAY